MGAVFTPNQVLGRTQTIGCAAVEITQRCNLDCTLCYLSEHSESVKDIPLEAVLARLDEIVAHYGSGAHVQISGGDPTLRKHTELIAIVRYAGSIGLHPALFTNGIAAPRRLLKRLAAAGLCDVAFHVDTTQQRHGYKTETDLNALRLEYMERARGLGLMVIFNTTVHAGNLMDVPMLVEFFARHADLVGFASLLCRPRWWYRSLVYLAAFIWRTRRDLLNGGRVHKLSLFIHDFMNANALDQERIDACSFMVMTADGPVSMCAHNARRDEYILKPFTITRRDGSVTVFQPLDN
jgi:uncharacterized radical SAM superfamily Fe-S cluster-containing enzyme